jgi:hypothetical protein
MWTHFYFPEPAYGFNEALILADDPGPVALFVTSPDGRRTGLDPATGITYHEDPAAVSVTDGAFADPFGVAPPGLPAKSIEVRSPVAGTYRFQVTGTGDGPATFATAPPAPGRSRSTRTPRPAPTAPRSSSTTARSRRSPTSAPTASRG